MGDSGWPLGLEPVHSKIEDDHPNNVASTPKMSSTSSSDETSNLETESSCSSNFFPADKPVTLGEILGMSFNHLAASSFRSIELYPTSTNTRSSGRNWGLWSLMSSCKCGRGSTSSSRFEETASLSAVMDRIYTNVIFEEEDGEEDHTDLMRATGDEAATENPLFLLDLHHHFSRNLQDDE